jgi:outer membrane immunogenic protein
MHILTLIACNIRNHLVHSARNIGSGYTRLVAVIFVFLSLTNLAWAANLSPPALAPVPFTWSGLYIGGNLGYAGATFSENVSSGGSGTISMPGFVGGGQIGANYQIGALVLGLETDFDATGSNQSTAVGAYTGTEQIPWMGTFRARVGVAFDRLFVYGTGGGAVIEVRSDIVNTSPAFQTTSTEGAWTAGGGIAYAINNSLSARIEDLYLDTGTFNVGLFNGDTITGRVRENLVRFGLDYRLPVAW